VRTPEGKRNVLKAKIIKVILFNHQIAGDAKGMNYIWGRQVSLYIQRNGKRQGGKEMIETEGGKTTERLEGSQVLTEARHC